MFRFAWEGVYTAKFYKLPQMALSPELPWCYFMLKSMCTTVDCSKSHRVQRMVGHTCVSHPAVWLVILYPSNQFCCRVIFVHDYKKLWIGPTFSSILLAWVYNTLRKGDFYLALKVHSWGTWLYNEDHKLLDCLSFLSSMHLDTAWNYYLWIFEFSWPLWDGRGTLPCVSKENSPFLPLVSMLC